MTERNRPAPRDLTAKKFRDLAASVFADPERRARVETEAQAAIAEQRRNQKRHAHGAGTSPLSEPGAD